MVTQYSSTSPNWLLWIVVLPPAASSPTITILMGFSRCPKKEDIFPPMLASSFCGSESDQTVQGGCKQWKMGSRGTVGRSCRDAIRKDATAAASRGLCGWRKHTDHTQKLLTTSTRRRILHSSRGEADVVRRREGTVFERQRHHDDCATTFNSSGIPRNFCEKVLKGKRGCVFPVIQFAFRKQFFVLI